MTKQTKMKDFFPHTDGGKLVTVANKKQRQRDKTKRAHAKALLDLFNKEEAYAAAKKLEEELLPAAREARNIDLMRRESRAATRAAIQSGLVDVIDVNGPDIVATPLPSRALRRQEALAQLASGVEVFAL